MFYDPRHEPHGLPHDPFLALVSPRPIGWISTVDRDGRPNLAPYSFYSAFSTEPKVVGFSASGPKDSLKNAESTGSFVVNVVSAELAREMNLTSAPVAHGTNEFEIAGLEMAASTNVSAPRVARAHAALECRTLQVIPLVGSSGLPAKSTLVLGEVVGIHIDPTILVNGLVDMTRLRPLARLGYMDYAVVEDVFSMARPSAADIAAMRKST